MFSLTTILFLGCNGENKNTDTGETKIDADGDGVFADIDCDDSNPNVSYLETFYQDNDGDGFGDENTSKDKVPKFCPDALPPPTLVKPPPPASAKDN